MKPIEETHPSFEEDWDKLLNWDDTHRGYDKDLIIEEIQIHTIDKAVLKDLIDEKMQCSNVGEVLEVLMSLKYQLGLEEEE